MVEGFKARKNAKGKAACEVCRWQPPIDGVRLLHAHHIVPVACGGEDHADNLVLLCPTHHAVAHSLGRMLRSWDDVMAWLGPTTRRELFGCFAILERPDHYQALKDREHNFTAHLADLYDEAAHMDAAHPGLVLDPAEKEKRSRRRETAKLAGELLSMANASALNVLRELHGPTWKSWRQVVAHPAVQPTHSFGVSHGLAHGQTGVA